jgi:SAM-dependent methyltransferase
MESIKHIIIQYWRYLWYSFRAFVLEKPRGLDFHARDKSFMVGVNNGYAVTPESDLRSIFKFLDGFGMDDGEGISNDDNFIDIGCGKGYVLTKAAKYPFNKITGIDIIPKMVSIAKRNLTILKLDQRCEIFEADAISYNYDEYNYFFFFDPFTENIFRMVIDSILESVKRKKRKIFVIYCRARSHYVFIETGRFKIVRKFHSLLKDFDSYIYSCEL